MAIDLKNIVFVGLNSRVAALNQNTGETLWEWRAPKPRTGRYVSLLLLDEARLIASVCGYTYGLDPRTGTQHWFNELKGFGTGVTSIVALNKHNPHDLLVAAASADAATAAASAAASGGG